MSDSKFPVNRDILIMDLIGFAEKYNVQFSFDIKSDQNDEKEIRKIVKDELVKAEKK